MILLFGEKVVLLKSIVKEYIDTRKIKDKLRQQIFEHFKHLFIYEKKNQYTLFEKSGGTTGLLTGTPSFQKHVVILRKYKLFEKSGLRTCKAQS